MIFVGSELLAGHAQQAGALGIVEELLERVTALLDALQTTDIGSVHAVERHELLEHIVVVENACKVL